MPEFHAHFVDAMYGQEEKLEAFLNDPTHMARARVYRNNSVSTCADAIYKNFPTVERLVGTEFARALAVAFVDAHPPSDPVLTLYGDGFAGFLESFPPAASLPYLPDVARLDRAWITAMYALNAPSLSARNLEGLDESAVAKLSPGLLPSAIILESDWPAWEIWQANRGDTPAKDLAIEPGWTAAIVWWSANGASNWQLNRGEFIFLSALQSGDALGTAIEKASLQAEPAKLFKFFSEALSAGLLALPPELSIAKT